MDKASKFKAEGLGVTPGLFLRRFSQSPRTVYLAASLLVFVISTFIALTQEPHPDPFKPLFFPNLDWWLYPLERNAFKRLPIVTDTLEDVFVLPGTTKVWAAGKGGMIIQSEDGGNTWKQQRIQIGKPPEELPLQPQPPAIRLSFELPTFIQDAHAA